MTGSELPRSPSLRLDGRRALVTGASRGLGRAAAAALVEAGAEVFLAARSADEIEGLAREIEATGGKARAVVLDLLAIDAVRRELDLLPPVDILVNNAGTNRPKPMLEVTEEDYDAVFDLNMKSAYFVAQHVAKRMIASGIRGSIIHMSSQMGHVGATDRTVYCASKHGIEGLTKAMAVELGPHGIRVNAIAPTFIETALTRPYFENPVFAAATLAKIKLGRVGVVEDIMGAIVFLASDASALITGTSLRIDGGWTAE